MDSLPPKVLLLLALVNRMLDNCHKDFGALVARNNHIFASSRSPSSLKEVGNGLSTACASGCILFSCDLSTLPTSSEGLHIDVCREASPMHTWNSVAAACEQGIIDKSVPA